MRQVPPRGKAMHEPFAVVRLGADGPNTSAHLFCVMAKGNPELVRTSESAASALINGAGGSDPAATKKSVQRLCDELNAVWARYILGEFAEG